MQLIWCIPSPAKQPSLGLCVQVLDPCGGIGLLAIEAAACAAVTAISLDIDPAACDAARTNAAAAATAGVLLGTVEVRCGDALASGLPGASVDLVVADLPFGVMHGVMRPACCRARAMHSSPTWPPPALPPSADSKGLLPKHSTVGRGSTPARARETPTPLFTHTHTHTHRGTPTHPHTHTHRLTDTHTYTHNTHTYSLAHNPPPSPAARAS